MIGPLVILLCLGLQLHLELATWNQRTAFNECSNHAVQTQYVSQWLHHMSSILTFIHFDILLEAGFSYSYIMTESYGMCNSYTNCASVWIAEIWHFLILISFIRLPFRQLLILDKQICQYYQLCISFVSIVLIQFSENILQLYYQW